MNPAHTARKRLRETITSAIMLRLEDELGAVIGTLPSDIPEEIREKIRQEVLPDARFHLGLLTLRQLRSRETVQAIIDNSLGAARYMVDRVAANRKRM